VLRHRPPTQRAGRADAAPRGGRPGAAQGDPAMSFRYAICNETFEGWDHDRVCRTAAEVGYRGLEIAPFTLAPRITDVSPERRRTLRKQAEDSGLTIIGLHWLLAKTEGLQVTSADPAVRARTADYLAALARCCRDLGGTLMVFGSPAQRRRSEERRVGKGWGSRRDGAGQESGIRSKRVG